MSPSQFDFIITFTYDLTVVCLDMLPHEASAFGLFTTMVQVIMFLKSAVNSMRGLTLIPGCFDLLPTVTVAGGSGATDRVSYI